MEIVGWSMGPVPLPRFLAPMTRAREWVDDEGRFRFDVEIGLRPDRSDRTLHWMAAA